MGAKPAFATQRSRQFATRSSGVCRLGGDALAIEMEPESGWSWDSKSRRLARASLSVLSVSLMVAHLLLLSSTVAAAAQSPTDPAEQSVMQSMTANAWLNKSGPDPCQDAWPGVTCDSGAPRQHVLAINLDNTDGIVAADFFAELGGLPHLTSLSLVNSGLVGNLSSLTADLSNLSSIRSLDLSGNAFVGEIPDIFSDLVSLQNLSIARNQLYGSVPEFVCQAKSLRVLILDGNSLGGSIPSCFGNLSSLAVLNMSYNILTGHIPETLGQLKNLQELDLGLNSFNGPLPASLTGMSNLTKLHLSGNLLEGPLPLDFHAMRSLQELYLDSNQFIGPIPDSICSLLSLRKLRLFDNLFTGSIPDDIGNLTQLTHLFLHVNQLSGNLPMSLGNLTLLQELHIQGNRFNGTLPGTVVAGFASLRSLYVQFNELEGNIPWQILLLSMLTNVSLGFNRFNGSIPDPEHVPSAAQLPNLNFLSMCNNSLTGPIPSALGKLGNLNFLDFSSNQLNGSIPSQLVSMINLDKVKANLIFNDFDETSWSAIPGGGACLQMMNYSSNVQCRSSGSFEELGINVGGPRYKSDTGQNFVADEAFSALLGSYENSSDGAQGAMSITTPWVVSGQGVVQENSKTSIITSSVGPPAGPQGNDWTLFQTARVGGDTLSYKIGSMKPGEYVCELLFAELDMSVSRPGQRVFNILIQGELRRAALDIFNETGGTMKPLILQFPISISLGLIDVRLEGRGSWPATEEQMLVYRGPILSALSIHRAKKTSSKTWVVLASALGGGGLLLALLLAAYVTFFLWRKRRRNRLIVCNWNNVGLLQFKYAELEAATRKFSDGNLLGQGAFGRVFKGVLPDGATVAIKQLSFPNPSTLECLQNELQVISTVRHRNLVALIGCCLDLDCPMIVCEYMPNGNLHDALFTESSSILLNWSARCKVAMDVARGLHYLHEESVHKIVHRDVKPANILLDSKLNAHIADFGMARLVAEQEIEVITGVMGTRGYMAPEYALNGQLSDKVDVFSFGVVLLELVIGRRGMQPALKTQQKVPLCHWAWEMFMAGKFEDMVDKRLGRDYDLSEVVTMLKVAIWCTEYYQSLRPSMSQVLHMLTMQAAIPPLPEHRKGYGEALYATKPFGSNSWEQCMSSNGGKAPISGTNSYSCAESYDFVDPELDSVEGR